MVEVSAEKTLNDVAVPRQSGVPLDSPLLPLMVSMIGISLMGLVNQIPKPDLLTAAFMGVAFATPFLMVFGPWCACKFKMALGRRSR